mgnify:CR=1 FL=1
MIDKISNALAVADNAGVGVVDGAWVDGVEVVGLLLLVVFGVVEVESRPVESDSALTHKIDFKSDRCVSVPCNQFGYCWSIIL